jgi:hypothetical protein
MCHTDHTGMEEQGIVLNSTVAVDDETAKDN